MKIKLMKLINTHFALESNFLTIKRYKYRDYTKCEMSRIIFVEIAKSAHTETGLQK